MPKCTANIEVLLSIMLKQQRDTEVGRETQPCDRHDPAPFDRNGQEEPFDSDERNTDRRQNKNERTQKGGHHTGTMIPKRSGLAGRLRREKVRVQRKKETALVDEIMARVAHQSDAVQQEPSDELSGDDDAVQRKREVQ